MLTLACHTTHCHTIIQHIFSTPRVCVYIYISSRLCRNPLFWSITLHYACVSNVYIYTLALWHNLIIQYTTINLQRRPCADKWLNEPGSFSDLSVFDNIGSCFSIVHIGACMIRSVPLTRPRSAHTRYTAMREKHRTGSKTQRTESEALTRRILRTSCSFIGYSP